MSELADSAVNILLVDDSPSVRTVLRTLLCGLGVMRRCERRGGTQRLDFGRGRVGGGASSDNVGL